MATFIFNLLKDDKLNCCSLLVNIKLVICKQCFKYIIITVFILANARNGDNSDKVIENLLNSSQNSEKELLNTLYAFDKKIRVILQQSFYYPICLHHFFMI